MSILGGGRKKAARDTRKNMFNVRRPVVLGFLTLFLLWGGLFGWGAFASISGAVIAAGRVEVEARDQVVEHIDGGTVREILVREGDTVKAGDVLLRFDDKLQRSEEAILAATHAELVARRNRLEAEFRGADAILWDAGLARRSRAEPAVRTILEGQKRLYMARRASRAGLEAQLRKRITQARKQVASLEAQVGAVRRQRGLRHPGAEGRAATLQGRSDGTAPAPGAGARSGRTRRPDRRYRGEDRRGAQPDCGDRDPDSPDRHGTGRGGGGRGARGAGAGE